ILNTQSIIPKTNKPPKEIVKPANQDKIIKEIAALRQGDYRLLQSKNYEVFLVNAEKIPNILHEIGRLREITFREIGEGTNQSIEINKYNQYYHQLFLWDEDVQKIAGAYRMGLGSEIFPKYEISGFYLQEFFRFENKLHDRMHKSIEMGRAFITSKYQQK